MVKLLVFAGSVRTGSFNGQLAAEARTLAGMGADVTRISLKDYPLPLMDEDLEAAEGIPENALKLGRMIAAQDGLFIACPEYNSSITPLLKNTLDWVSRISTLDGRPSKPWRGKVVALGSASNGQFAGIRGLVHVRAILQNIGTQVVSEQCSVSGAAKAFGEDGRLLGDRQAHMLEAACRSLVEHAKVRVLP